MKRSGFTEVQIAFALQQAELGTWAASPMFMISDTRVDDESELVFTPDRRECS